MSIVEHLREGMRAARAGDFEQAQVSFRAVMEEEPTNETALLWLGYLADDPQVSLKYITTALEAHVQSPRAYAALRWAWRRAATVSTAAPMPPESDAGEGTSTGERRGRPATRLPPWLGLLLLLLLVGGLLGMPWLRKPPAMAAVPPHPTTTTIPTQAAPATPTLGWGGAGSAAPTLVFLPTATPGPSPTPMPTVSPPPEMVIPEPFPIPGPRAYVPSTTLLIPTPVMPVPVAADAVNIVVLGSDQRPDWSEWHTDVVQVVSIQKSTGVVSIISIPRDLYVYIPGFWMSRINFADYYGTAYGYEGGGPALVRDTLLYNLGIRVDHYVRTNFDGLIGIVDTLGGIDIPVHCQLSDYWPYPDENGVYQIITVEPGVHHLDGEAALWYARSRKTTSVFDRERRQQQVLQAIWHRAREAGMLSRVPALWQQGREMVETDLSLGDALVLAKIALALDDRDVRFYNIGAEVLTPWTTPYGGSVFLPRWDAIRPLLAEAMAPPPAARLARTYRPVEVWNGTTHPDWDVLAADRLYRAGFPAVIGEADRHDYPHTQLLVFSPRLKGSGASYLQEMFGLSDERVILSPDPEATVGFRLVLGADYHTCPYR